MTRFYSRSSLGAEWRGGLALVGNNWQFWLLSWALGLNRVLANIGLVDVLDDKLTEIATPSLFVLENADIDFSLWFLSFPFTWSFACWSSWSQMTRRREFLVELEPWRPRYHRPNRQHCPSSNWLKHVLTCSDYLANEWWFLGQFCVAFLTTGLGAELAEVGWGNVLDDQEGLAVDGALLELENAKIRLFWVLVTWITAQTRPNGRLSL